MSLFIADHAGALLERILERIAKAGIFISVCSALIFGEYLSGQGSL
jgi:hypothetical protein